MKSRTTTKHIHRLEEDQIFVFASNEAGYHGKGAANTAYLKYGAKYYQGFGIQGKSFAIPTKDKNLKVLSLHKIGNYVSEFIKKAKLTTNKTFLVTEIGCGLAGYKPSDIAPLFKEAIDVDNIHLPKSFWEFLLK